MHGTGGPNPAAVDVGQSLAMTSYFAPSLEATMPATSAAGHEVFPRTGRPNRERARASAAQPACAGFPVETSRPDTDEHLVRRKLRRATRVRRKTSADP
jgi:hypothetical protein